MLFAGIGPHDSPFSLHNGSSTGLSLPFREFAPLLAGWPRVLLMLALESGRTLFFYFLMFPVLEMGQPGLRSIASMNPPFT